MKLLLSVVFALAVAGVSAESKPAYLGYTVEYLDQIQIFTGLVTLGDLFDAANAAQTTGTDGQVLTSQVDKRTLLGTTLTYLLTAKVDKKAALKATIKFTIKEEEDTVTMTSIKVTDAATGKFSQADFDGSMNSLGRILGIFSGVAAMFVDVDKVNDGAAKRQLE